MAAQAVLDIVGRGRTLPKLERGIAQTIETVAVGVGGLDILDARFAWIDSSMSAGYPCPRVVHEAVSNFVHSSTGQKDVNMCLQGMNSEALVQRELGGSLSHLWFVACCSMLWIDHLLPNPKALLRVLLHPVIQVGYDGDLS